MTIVTPLTWPTDVTQARAVQESLRGKVFVGDKLGVVRTVAGVDVGYEHAGAVTRAAVVVLDFPGLEPREQAVARQPTRFPYVPGYLSFREAPAVLAALAQLRQAPDLLLCDGQGIAHPRRFGIACHLGVLTNIPSIGVAKSRLIGTHGAVPKQKGAWVPLLDYPSSPSLLPRGEKGASRGALRAHPEIIGAVLRTRNGVKPLYVSIGHRVSLETAIDYVLRCTTRYRLPETTRLADRLASRRDVF
ncbi:MAG: endonuclease V [Bacteroidota bacterium]